MIRFWIDGSLNQRRVPARCNRLTTAVFALALFIGPAVSVSAQNSTPMNSTAVDQWVNQVRSDATRGIIESSLDPFLLDPNLINPPNVFGSSFRQIGLRPSDVFATAGDGVDLWNAFHLQSQRGEAASELSGFFLKAAGRAGDFPLLGEAVGFDKELHDAYRGYKAFERQNEAQGLPLGGVLSTARIGQVQYAPPNFDAFGGQFHAGSPQSSLAISGSWILAHDVASEQFTAQAEYTFNHLETASGHSLSGYGRVTRQRAEQNDPFDNVPLLRWVSLFDFNDPMTMTERTVRRESYNESFNGALANQAIERATVSGLQPRFGYGFNRETPRLNDLDDVKHLGSVYPPPPAPPRPHLAVSNNDKTQVQRPANTVSAKSPSSQPTGASAVTSPKTSRGGVMADIRISDADFAAPKDGAKK
jgi:hypothetical protein